MGGVLEESPPVCRVEPTHPKDAYPHHEISRDGDTNVWYWVGSHADYDAFTGDTSGTRRDSTEAGAEQDAPDPNGERRASARCLYALRPPSGQRADARRSPRKGFRDKILAETPVLAALPKRCHAQSSRSRTSRLPIARA
jgi:hypothetical protein